MSTPKTGDTLPCRCGGTLMYEDRGYLYPWWQRWFRGKSASRYGNVTCDRQGPGCEAPLGEPRSSRPVRIG